MNIGIYIQNLSDQEKLKEASEAMNHVVDNRIFDDASIFYDNIGYNPFSIKCGLFNSTDLWNFNGLLISTCLNTSMSAMKIVNSIDIYYYYGFENKVNPLSLIYLLNNKIKFISRSQSDSEDLYRKTKQKSVNISPSFKDLILNIR